MAGTIDSQRRQARSGAAGRAVNLRGRLVMELSGRQLRVAPDSMLDTALVRKANGLTFVNESTWDTISAGDARGIFLNDFLFDEERPDGLYHLDRVDWWQTAIRAIAFSRETGMVVAKDRITQVEEDVVQLFEQLVSCDKPTAGDRALWFERFSECRERLDAVGDRLSQAQSMLGMLEVVLAKEATR